MSASGDNGALSVALVSDCYVPDTGGIEVQAHDLARHLVAARHRVVVVTTTPGPDTVDGVRVVRLAIPRSQSWLPVVPDKVPLAPSVFAEVADVLAAEDVDVAHFHGGILSPLAFKGAADAQAAGIPTVVTTHCLWSYATPLFDLLDRRYGWTRWPVVLSAVSEAAAEPLRRIAGPDTEVTILPNGIDTQWWAPAGPDFPVDPAPGAATDDDVFSVVAVMRLAPRKRPLQLVAVLAAVARGLDAPQRLRAVIVGDGSMRWLVQRYIDHLGMTGTITLAGRLDRAAIRRLYTSVDAFVAPADLESFGIAALEARTAGVPVVAKVRTGVREFVEHGREGLLAIDDRDLTRQLLRLARDPGLRQAIAAHNQSVPPVMDWDAVVQANVAAYRRAIALAVAHRDQTRSDQTRRDQGPQADVHPVGGAGRTRR
jgi:phosphatidylinositol alpha 1,6-mannosyltransferase